MNSEKLDSLFGEIRNEVTETSTREVGKWIAVSAASLGLFGLLSQFKLPILLTKKLIIMTSLITTLGITAAVFLVSSPEKSKDKETSTDIAQTSIYSTSKSETENKQVSIIEEPKMNQSVTLTQNDQVTSLAPLPPMEISTNDRLNGFNIPPTALKAPCSDDGKSVDGIERSIGRFKKIKVGGAFSILITQGETESILFKTSKEIADNIETTVNDGVLEITNGTKRRKNGGAEIQITVTDLDEVIISGASQLKTLDLLNAPNLKIKASGACSIIMEIRSDALKVQTNGASSLSLSGSATSVNMDIGGASNISAFDLKTVHTEIKSSGAANIECHASENLIIHAKDASNITYDGTPANLDTKTSISANVKQR